MIHYTVLLLYLILKITFSIVIFVLRLEEQGVTLNDDLIKKKKEKKKGLIIDMFNRGSQPIATDTESLVQLTDSVVESVISPADSSSDCARTLANPPPCDKKLVPYGKDSQHRIKGGTGFLFITHQPKGV